MFSESRTTVLPDKKEKGKKGKKVRKLLSNEKGMEQKWKDKRESKSSKANGILKWKKKG